MDAVRLIETCRGALAQSGEVTDTLKEAWQAQALTQAIGSRLTTGGPRELRGDALALGEAGTRGCTALGVPAFGAEGIRAARLTTIGDPKRSLFDLGTMLAEVGMALVGIASSADEDAIYWQCMEAIDAADESRDRVVAMLRRLAEREHTLPTTDSPAETA
ncbi:DUF6099 family protein [Streptomyces sp. NPDC050560]|uniref:DUF6099 family protein n=1 Tax=Streptomyces sp. NPDC050560 TaxID=3365630 RepID=UPI0037A04363